MSRRNRVLPNLWTIFAFASLLCASSLGFAQNQTHVRSNSNSSVALEKEVYHQLVLLPYLTVFDNLQFQINDSSVTLLGQVTQPTLKGDAEKAVKDIEGVTQVTNNIEVLPESPMDDGIRRAEYRAIYGYPALERYAEGNMPTIHIIVKGGHVTLLGTVSNAMDQQLANTRALSVPNVFSVMNELKIQPKS